MLGARITWSTMKFAFASIRSRCTELTAATARIPIQTHKNRPCLLSVQCISKTESCSPLKFGRAIRVVLGVPRGCRPWWGRVVSAGYSPQPGYSQLSDQIPLCTPCPTSPPDMVRVDHWLPDEKPGRMAKAFPTVCKRMHEHQLRKSNRLPLGCKRHNRQ
jgi:hypothetical protein